MKIGIARVAGVLLTLLMTAAGLFAEDELSAAPELRFRTAEEQSVTLEAGEDWLDPGTDFEVKGGLGLPFLDRLLAERRAEKVRVSREGVCETGRPGVYPLTYRAFYRDQTAEITRTVTVRDTRAPELELLGSGSGVNPLLGYAEEGFRAYDAVDGDLTGQVIREEGEGFVRYRVCDGAGNETEAVRELSYCDWRPVLTLTGGDVELCAFETFEEPGFTAVDEAGNDLSGLVRISGNRVPSYKTGSYRVVYTVTGPDGVQVSAVRTVRVTPVRVPAEKRVEGKVLYLTFDDGPSPYTGELLDVLAKYGVKVTFFVTGNHPENRDMITRAYEEGHAIGVHTYSHDLERVYSSTEAFLEDLFKAEEVVCDATGHYTRLMRFAGGSSCIRFYNTDLVVSLLREVTSRGFKYFDWNVSSGDGSPHTTAQTVRYVKNGVNRRSGLCVVLQHDTQGFSVAGVEEIILWAMENGYRFETLTIDSWGSQQRFPD